MNDNRVQNIMERFNSFNKTKYHKSEVLAEMLSLQQELVELTFNGDHAENADLRIWDVEKHLQELNAELGNVADEELRRFMDDCKVLCNLIKAEISGNKGEQKAFRLLEYIRGQKTILKNVELSDGDLRTEIDAVVITPGALIIVEVKNTSKDIFIDEKGGYYRTGEFLKWDCNIADKMDTKEALLRKALHDEDGLLNIQRVVVFTNNRIEVHNRYKHIRICFLSQLAYVIGGYVKEPWYSQEDMDRFSLLIEEASYKEDYPLNFDPEQLKLDFATVMATLEEEKNRSVAAEEKVALENDKEICEEKVVQFSDILKALYKSKYIRYAGRVAAVVAVSMITSSVSLSGIHRGGI